MYNILSANALHLAYLYKCQEDPHGYKRKTFSSDMVITLVVKNNNLRSCNFAKIWFYPFGETKGTQVEWKEAFNIRFVHRNLFRIKKRNLFALASHE